MTPTSRTAPRRPSPLPPAAPAPPAPPSPTAGTPEPAGRGADAAGGTPWLLERCPPRPLVRARDLCLPTGGVPDGAVRVVGDVLAVGGNVGAAQRATALALVLPHGHGVVVRATAAWLWTGETSLRPVRADLASPPGAPPLPGPRPEPALALPVRRVRWSDSAVWDVVAGVAVTPPAPTAAECARLLPAPLARRCLQALVRAVHVDPDDVAQLLRTPARAGGPAPPGTADALALLASLGEP